MNGNVILFLILLCSVINLYAQTPVFTPSFADRILLPRRPRPAIKKPNSEQRKKLQPAPADLAKYSEFLQGKNTGIFRLFPDQGCVTNIDIISAEKKCLEAVPLSSSYSFRENEYTTDYLSDIHFKSNHLISLGTLSQNLLVNLGDVDLNKVSLATTGLNFINSFTAQTEFEKIQAQYQQLVKGVKSGNFIYGKALPVVENSTYALRVIAFRGSAFKTFRGFRYNLLEGDKRIDMTIALRVISRNSDGSITILWKELRRGESPKFERKKQKQLSKIQNNKKNER